MSGRRALTLIAVLGLVAGLVAGCTGPADGPGPATTGQPSATTGQPSATGEPSGPVGYDLGRDFSFTANPNGPWRYGYTTGTQLARAAFAPVTVTEVTPTVTFWHPGSGRAGYYPYLAANPGSIFVADPTGSWALRPGEVALEASETGQLAVVEFTVPATGSYAIAADFAGLHRNLSTTDAHVLLNDESLFAADIDGYGGDPAFFARQGANPTASYHATRVLRAGDVLTFALGSGANHTHQNDTSGLILTIRPG